MLLLIENNFLHLLAQQFLSISVLEWVGFVTTIACIYLAAKENVLNWPISIISIVISGILYYQSNLFGDLGLQFYFLFTAIYGWWFWQKKGDFTKPIVKLTTLQWLYVVKAILILSLFIGKLLSKYTTSDVPYEDGFCTAMSLIAQFLLTRKVLGNWLLWIVVDICYIPLLIYKDLNLYAILYAVLAAIAVKGYVEWKRKYSEQEN